MTIAIIPTKASQIRAIRDLDPTLSEKEIARRVGVLKSTVRNALASNPRRRIKTVVLG